jgi:hypothetical protein
VRPRRRATAAAPTNPTDDFSRDVAGAWSALSPYKNETGIAVERWRLAATIWGLDPVLSFYAIATLAAQGRDRWHPNAPYHAVVFTEKVARTFIARIHEVLREVDKADQNERPPRVLNDKGLRPIAAALKEWLRHE